MTEQERNVLNMVVKYFEILHLSMDDLESRIRSLEIKAGDASKGSSFPLSLRTQLGAIQQEIVKILR